MYINLLLFYYQLLLYFRVDFFKAFKISFVLKYHDSNN